LSEIGSMITKVTMNMCGTLMPDGSAQTSLRPVLLAKRYAQERVVHGAQKHHQADGRENASEHQRVRHLKERTAAMAVSVSMLTRMFGAEAEECVPIAGRP